MAKLVFYNQSKIMVKQMFYTVGSMFSAYSSHLPLRL